MTGPARAKPFDSIEARVAVAAVLASFGFFFWRLSRFVSRNTVDVPYWDLWDVLGPFFRDEGLWAAFRYQHGPVRQGLGALLFFASNELTNWSFRAPSLQIVIILLVASILALELKIRLYGRIVIADALIAPVFFRLGQGAAIVLAPYPACVALPLVLVLLGCRTLLVRDERTRLAALAIIAFFSAYTGFAMFLPPALLVIFLLRGAIEWREGLPDRVRANVRAALVVAIGATPAMAGLDPRSFGRIACPDGAPAAIDYGVYVVTMINGSFGIFRRDGGAALAGSLIFLVPIAAIVVLAVRGVATSARQREGELATARFLVPLVLLAFSLGFAFATSLGRICAPGAALNSRYFALMAPLGLGLYFGVRAWEASTERARAIRRLLVGLLVFLSFASALPVSSFDAQMVEEAYTGKLRWVDCVKRGGSAAECNARAQFLIHPSPEGSRIDEKLDFLRHSRRSLFAPPRETRARE